MKFSSDDSENQRKLKLRIQQLKNQLDVITGGELSMGTGDGDLPLEAELSFLEHMITMETAPRVSWKTKLEREGYTMPAPHTLSDEAMALELWQVIQRLSEQNVFLSCTNHLSDQELYHYLYDDAMNVENFDLPVHPDRACHIDLVSSGSDEDIQLWLRYYADEETRKQWAADYPKEIMPPAEKPPHQRDHLLPEQEYRPLPIHSYTQILLEGKLTNHGPMKLSDQLRAEDIESSPVYLAACAVLEAMAALGKVKPTATLGNLPRAFVSKVYPYLPISESLRDSHRRVCKKLDEEDVFLLHQIRLMAQEAKLIRKYKGHFIATKRGKVLLQKEQAGALYHSLFMALFSKLNLAYFDTYPDCPGIQETLPVIFWRLSVVAQNWVPVSAIEQDVCLPLVLDEVEAQRGPYDQPGSILTHRLLEHLQLFGLLEFDQPDLYRNISKINLRITPLFDKFFSFDPSSLDA